MTFSLHRSWNYGAINLRIYDHVNLHRLEKSPFRCHSSSSSVFNSAALLLQQSACTQLGATFSRSQYKKQIYNLCLCTMDNNQQYPYQKLSPPTTPVRRRRQNNTPTPESVNQRQTRQSRAMSRDQQLRRLRMSPLRRSPRNQPPAVPMEITPPRRSPRQAQRAAAANGTPSPQRTSPMDTAGPSNTEPQRKSK